MKLTHIIILGLLTLNKITEKKPHSNLIKMVFLSIVIIIFVILLLNYYDNFDWRGKAFLILIPLVALTEIIREISSFLGKKVNKNSLSK